MLRRNLCLLCIIILAATAGVAAGGKKKKSSGGGLDSIDTKSVNVTVSEGSTAIALRGIVEPEGATCCAVLAVDAAKGLVTVRMRKSGSIFKLLVPASVAGNVEIGDDVTLNLAAQNGQIEGLPGLFSLLKKDGEPCCLISVIGPGASVTVKEPAVWRSFQLQVSSDLISKLQVGQKVQADFKAKSATVVGITGALPISNLSQPATPQL